MIIKSICVFCGSSNGTKPIYENSAKKLGKMLAEENITLVYGGGNSGLMGALADEVMARNGRVIGIIPKFFAKKDLAHRGITELKIVDSMHERKTLMAKLADGFIALPGGIGTLEELSEILTWAQIGLHNKPCGIMNVSNYYKNLLTFFEHSARQGFFRPGHSELLYVEKEPTKLLKIFAKHASRKQPKLDSI